MKKLLTISFLALVTSLAHAGSCGDPSGDDKEGGNTGVTKSAVILACDQAGDGEGKRENGQAGFSSVPFELAGSCGDDRKTDTDKKNGKAAFSA